MGAVRRILTIILLAAAIAAVTSSFTCDRTWPSSIREPDLRKGKPHSFNQGTMPGLMFTGHVYRVTSARSYVMCAVVCLLDDACKSYNFCMDGKVCQLNSAVYNLNSTTLQRADSCVYFDEGEHKGGPINFPAGGDTLSAVTEILTQTTMTPSPLIETYAPPLKTTARAAVESSAIPCPRSYTTQSSVELTAEQHLPFVFDFTVSRGNEMTLKLLTNNNVYIMDITATSIRLSGSRSSSSYSGTVQGKQIHLVVGVNSIKVSLVGGNISIESTVGQEGTTCSITLMSTEESTWTIDSCDVNFS